MPKIIFICHPWAGNLKPTDYNPFPELTKKICRHIAKNSDDIPLSTGLYFNEFLYDDLDSERDLGIKCGHYLMEKCDIVFSYEMHGVSGGMKKDLEIAEKMGLEIKHLTKYPWEV